MLHTPNKYSTVLDILIDIRIIAANAVLIPPTNKSASGTVGGGPNPSRSDPSPNNQPPPFFLAGGPTQAYLVDIAMRVSSEVS